MSVERFDWAGRGVSAAEVAGELARLHGETMGPGGHGHAALRTINLVVAPGEEAAVAGRLGTLRARHPSRTIVLREHRAEAIDADVAVECLLAPGGGPGLCHDRVTLAAPPDALAHADSLVAGLLVAGLPVAAWLPAEDGGPAAAALARLADVVVIDSGRASAAPAALRLARRLRRRAVVLDLAWAGLAPWRRRIAGAFEPEDRRRLLPLVDGVDVLHGPGDEAAALLLAGWLSARGGWPFASVVRAVATEDPGIGGVRFRAGAQTVLCDTRALVAPRGDALVTALGPIGRPPPGYDAALEAAAA